MTDDRLAVLLHDAAADVEVPPAPADRILAAGRRRLRRRRVAELAGTVAAVTAVAVLVPLGITARSPSLATSAPPAPSAPCTGMQRAVLPEWARGGFNEPEPVMPFVLGDRGEIVAILWNPPLSAPPLPDQTNKILWAARDDDTPGPLTITARLVGAPGEPVVIEDPTGPGPSTLDLPTPGCWELELRWAEHVDTLDLRYEPPS